MSQQEVGSNQEVSMSMEVSSSDNGSDSVSGSDFGPPAMRSQKARNGKPVMYAQRATKLAASILKKARTRRIAKRTTCGRRRTSCSKRIAMHFRIAYLENENKRLRAYIKIQEGMEKAVQKMEDLHPLLHQTAILLQSINQTMTEIREMLTQHYMNPHAPVVRAASSDVEAETSSGGDLTEESDHSEADAGSD